MCVFFPGIHTRVGAPTLRQRSRFKHIKSTADYVCRYYPKNQRCAFSKETQTITDLITPELYRSCCSVFTLSDMAETTAQIRREETDSHLNFSSLACLSPNHKNHSVRQSLERGPKSRHSRTKTNRRHIRIFKDEFLYLLAAAGSVL